MQDINYSKINDIEDHTKSNVMFYFYLNYLDMENVELDILDYLDFHHNSVYNWNMIFCWL